MGNLELKMIKELVKDRNNCWGYEARRDHAAIVLWCCVALPTQKEASAGPLQLFDDSLDDAILQGSELCYLAGCIVTPSLLFLKLVVQEADILLENVT